MAKLPIISKIASSKSCWKLNFLQKTQWAHMCISPRVELGALNIAVSNIITYWNGKIDLLKGSTLPKLPIISKNSSNKSCWKLNFLQKTERAHFSISLMSRAKGSKDCHVLNITMYWNEKVYSL